MVGREFRGSGQECKLFRVEVAALAQDGEAQHDAEREAVAAEQPAGHECEQRLRDGPRRGPAASDQTFT